MGGGMRLLYRLLNETHIHTAPIVWWIEWRSGNRKVEGSILGWQKFSKAVVKGIDCLCVNQKIVSSNPALGNNIFFFFFPVGLGSQFETLAKSGIIFFNNETRDGGQGAQRPF